MGDGDDHQGDEEPEPVASSTSDAAGAGPYSGTLIPRKWSAPVR
jgi:hypothetical protein